MALDPTSKSRSVALVTGGARGIGRAIGLALAERGWDLAYCYRQRDREAEETRQAIEANHVRALAIRADVGRPEEARALVSRVERELGRIDALVHCAGPYHRVDLLSETDEGWREMFESNLHSLFYCATAVVPGMIERKRGRIVAFSMANADKLAAQPQLTAHYAAKVGVIVLVRSLARTLAPHGITANAISPGFIDSGSAPTEELEKMRKMIPAGRIGTVDEAASLALFLLSEQAEYINGANIPLSGAWGI